MKKAENTKMFRLKQALINVILDLKNSFFNSKIILGSIASRFSGKEPALLGEER